MPKNYIGFQSGNHGRCRIANPYDARHLRVQSGCSDRIDCRGARRNRVVWVERQYFATDDDRNKRHRSVPFGSDQ